ncbi:MAG: penicillin-binding protein 2 [Patescibacteria group bacterium]|nr:penicillin-binding protein 2 [Patescibacteria group bacterium]
MDDPFKIKQEDKNIRDGNLEGFNQRRYAGNYWPPEENWAGPIVLPMEKKSLNIFIFLMIAVSTIVFGRIFWLQVFSGHEFRNMAEGNRIRVETIKADRGLIYDRYQTPLVKNTPNFSLIITPLDLPKNKETRIEIVKKTLSFLGESLDNSTKEEVSKLTADQPNQSVYPVVLKDNLSYKEAIKLKLEELPGVSVIVEPKRQYSDPTYFSHVIGYMGKITPEELADNKEYSMTDSLGKTGLELNYENILKGENGETNIEVDSLGREKRIASQKIPQTGQDLILTIDAGLQKKVTDVLSHYIKTAGARAGSAVAIDPRNGEILAIVSWPTFDNNIFIQASAGDFKNLIEDPYKPLFFRAISGQYPSGSIFKPIEIAAAFAEGIINEKTTILSTGGVRIGQWFFADWKAGGHGVTDFKKALAESVNTFFYYIGGGFGNFKGLGPEKIIQYAELFGLNSKTGVDLKGEATGFLLTPDYKENVQKQPWYIGDTYHLSIGQSNILVTPIQVANYTAAIANGKTLFQPRLVKEIDNPETGQKIIIQPQIIRENFIDAKYLELVREGMRQTITTGSARSLNTLPIQVAGKTGTAQVEGKGNHAWFTCFAPYENPEIALTILVENGGEGSSFAAPAAKEILSWWAEQKKK